MVLPNCKYFSIIIKCVYISSLLELYCCVIVLAVPPVPVERYVLFLFVCIIPNLLLCWEDIYCLKFILIYLLNAVFLNAFDHTGGDVTSIPDCF